MSVAGADVGPAIPDSVRAWVNESIGPDELVVASTAMAGATSSSVFQLTTMTRRGSRRRLVLRWYPAPHATDPSREITREATALETIAAAGIPAPGLVAHATSGDGVPALLMTHLPGSPVFDRLEPAALLDVLDGIHAVEPGRLAAYRYAGYHDGKALTRPDWWRDHPAWERAVCQTTTARPTGPACLIHRDFHPGNLLWLDGRLTGVVDWVNACVGPAAVDAAHCRVNLAILWGPNRADAILPGDPVWDIELAFGILDFEGGANDDWPGAIPGALTALGAPSVDAATARLRLEGFVQRALAELG